MATRLTGEAAARAVAALPGWSLDGETIRKTFTFADFQEAIAFVVAVAFKAEAAGHHPDIDIRWNRVTLALTTHDAGGLTDRDVELASAVEPLARRS
ncbi:MAG TPA: 4a-hydroxytetrahydrobiopterin dehydratase [Thermodesulfobacteriota bacterium]